jgi:Tfp pilus assembly protein FimV
MDRLPDLSSLTSAEKDALIQALWAQVQALTVQVATLTARVADLEAKLGVPPKTPDTSSLPPSQGNKPNRDAKPARAGPRQGSLGRTGGAGGCWPQRRTRPSPPARPAARSARPRCRKPTRRWLPASTR